MILLYIHIFLVLTLLLAALWDGMEVQWYWIIALLIPPLTELIILAGFYQAYFDEHFTEKLSKWWNRK